MALFMGTLSYVLAHAGVLPVLTYVPLEGRWTFSPGDAIAMGYYGMVLTGLVGAALGALVGWRWGQHLRRPPWPARLSTLVGSTVVLALAYIVVSELVIWSR